MLDDLDRSILAHLGVDGRASFRAVAAALGSTTPTVSARVRRMQDLGIIQGFRVVLGPSAGRVIEVTTTGAEPPGKILGQTAEPGGMRFRVVVDDEDGLHAWASTHGATYGDVVESDGRAAAWAPKLACHTCHGPLPVVPVERRLAGRAHVFCCTTCMEQMVERARRAGAEVE